MTKLYRYKKALNERLIFVIDISTAVAIGLLAAVGLYILSFPTLDKIIP